MGKEIHAKEVMLRFGFHDQSITISLCSHAETLSDIRLSLITFWMILTMIGLTAEEVTAWHFRSLTARNFILLKKNMTSTDFSVDLILHIARTQPDTIFDSSNI
jgi:hypothetical protein